MTKEDTKAKNFHISRFFTESAIEAMEEACHTGASDRESCEDAISRRAVLDTLDKMDSVLDEDRTVETYKELLAACYNDLPPVTPVYKQKWIPCNERLPEPKETEKESVLDKIRAEIAECGSIRVTFAITDETKTDKGIEKLVRDILARAKEQVLDIIDKYKAEMEGEE